MSQNLLNKRLLVFLVILLSIIIILFYLQLSKILVFSANDPMLAKSFNVFLLIVAAISLLFTILLFFKVARNTVVYQSAKQSIETDTIKQNKKAQEEELRLIEEKKQMEELKLRLLQNLNNQVSLSALCDTILSNMCKEFEGMQALFYLIDKNENLYKPGSTYAFYSEEELKSFAPGEGLTGQVAKNKEALIIEKLPENYLTVLSGLGKSNPRCMIIFPIVSNDESLGVVEVATFKSINRNIKPVIDDVAYTIGDILAQML